MRATRIPRLTLFAISLLLLAPGCRHAPEPKGETPPAQQEQPDEGGLVIQEGSLPNGLKILVQENHSAPVVAVEVFYRTGSRNEKVGVRGMAHLFEHMMFKGSEKVGPEMHARIIQSVGGDLNGATSKDITFYYDVVPSDRMALAMELEAERMTKLKLDESHFNVEREVVKEELRVRLQNNPIGSLFEKLQEVAYTKHPYQWTEAGTLEDLDKITIEDIRNFYKTYYCPNNAVLIVVGDATFAQVMQQATEFFGPLARKDLPPAVDVVEPEQTAYKHLDLKLPAQLPTVLAGYKVPQASHPDMPALDVIEAVLSGGESARLNKNLVRDKKMAVFAGAGNSKRKDPGLFMLIAGFMPPVTAKDMEEALLQEVERLAKDGPTPAELAKAKTQLVAGYLFQLTSMGYVGVQIGSAELVEGDYHRFLEGAKPYEKVTAEDVKRVAGQYLKRERLTAVALTPTAPGEADKKAAAPAKAETKKAEDWPTEARFLKLSAPPAEPIGLPLIVQKTLANGLNVMVVERRENPLLYFALRLKGGKQLDPKGKAGLMQLLADMWTKGTPGKNGDQIADAVESLGGGLGGSISTESLELSGSFLAKDFEKGLGLFSEVALHPTFPVDELEKARQPLLGSVRMKKDNPQAVAGEHLLYLIYGYDNPRGRPTREETLNAVSLADIQSMWKQLAQPDVAYLTVTGDFDAAWALAMVERAFSSWAKTGNAPAIAPDPAPLSARKIRLVDKPDLTQTSIFLGELGINRANPDYFNLMLGNYVLGGGGFSSRLMKSVRSQGGKTYGVSSYFASGLTRGPFVANTFTRNAEVGATTELILKEIEAMQKDGVTDDELLSAKNNLAGSAAIDLQPPEGMAAELGMAEFYGLGVDWVRNYRQNISTPTREQVNASMAKYLDLQRLAMVMVGNVAEIKAQAAKFGKPATVKFLEPVPDEERKAAAGPAKGKAAGAKKPAKKKG